MNVENIIEEGVYDPVGTIRACDNFEVLALYIKVAQNCWRSIYIDQHTGEHFIPPRVYSDALAVTHPVVFVPKPVE